MPGKWVGVAVFSNTFRHPALLAKGATLLDTMTGGRFILGLGAGWHEGEHEAFGIPLPPMRERFDRYESALRVLEALFSDAARQAPGVTLDDPFYPLRGATNEPPPVRPGGPLIWLGGQKPRGIALAARFASGWPMPGNRPGDVAYFADRRDAIRAALEAAGRDPEAFSFAGQLSCGSTAADRTAARETAIAFVRAGATHVILGVPASVAPEHLRLVADEVAEPALGRGPVADPLPPAGHDRRADAAAAYWRRDDRPQRDPAAQPAADVGQPARLRRVEAAADPVRPVPDRPVGAARALRRGDDADPDPRAAPGPLHAQGGLVAPRVPRDAPALRQGAPPGRRRLAQRLRLVEHRDRPLLRRVLRADGRRSTASSASAASARTRSSSCSRP